MYSFTSIFIYKLLRNYTFVYSLQWTINSANDPAAAYSTCAFEPLDSSYSAYSDPYIRSYTARPNWRTSQSRIAHCRQMCDVDGACSRLCLPLHDAWIDRPDEWLLVGQRRIFDWSCVSCAPHWSRISLSTRCLTGGNTAIDRSVRLIRWRGTREMLVVQLAPRQWSAPLRQRSSKETSFY